LFWADTLEKWRAPDLYETGAGKMLSIALERSFPWRSTRSAPAAILNGGPPRLARFRSMDRSNCSAYRGLRRLRSAVSEWRTRPSSARAGAATADRPTSVGRGLHPDKTHIVNASQRGGFGFPGYHFGRCHQWPREKSLKKIKDSLRGLTKRTKGWGSAAIISKVKRSLMGWLRYFTDSFKTTFDPIHGWSRMRVRSILRKRRRVRAGSGDRTISGGRMLSLPTMG
jgi:hypothetical protein